MQGLFIPAARQVHRSKWLIKLGKVENAVNSCYKESTRNTLILVKLLFERGLGICASIFVKDFADSYNSYNIPIKNVKVLVHFLYSQYALEIVRSCTSNIDCKFVESRFCCFPIVFLNDGQHYLWLFSLGQIGITQNSTLRMAKLDLAHLYLQVFHPWLCGKKAHNVPYFGFW